MWLRRIGAPGPAIVLLLLAGGLVSHAWAGEITSVTNYQIVARLTGADSINHTNTYDIGGCDLGHMVNYNGKTYFLFGDTFSGETPTQGGNWRNNTMAYSTDANFRDGITFDGWVNVSPTNGRAREVISPANTMITNIPTGAISVNGYIYAWYMSVSDWNGWKLDHAGLARWNGTTNKFQILNDSFFAGDSSFGMVAASQRSPLENVNDNYVYVWGTPGGRQNGVKLARVLPTDIENHAAYQYYDGTANGSPQWISDEYAAEVIVPPGVGEMSVMYNQAVGEWTMMYLNGINYAIEMRQSPTPWGPWSDPIRVKSTYLGLDYAPFMNPLYIEDGGRTIYFTISEWSTYDVYLAKATLNIIPEPGTLALFGVGMGVVSMIRRRNRHV